MKRVFTLFLALLFCLTATAAMAEQITLKLTYWGSPIEKEALINSLDLFMQANPDIKVEAQHIPDDYETKITTMIAGNIAPDVAYMSEGLALQLAEEGKLYNIQEFLDNDTELNRDDFLPNIWYNYGEGKTLGTNTACEAVAMYYNKDMFDAAGLAYPPTTPETAWDWDTFLENAQKLTIDYNGKNALDPEFDPNNIRQFGVQFGTAYAGYLWAVLSNGGAYASEDGKQLLLNSPEAVEALQKMSDLINVYHVSPSPIQAKAMPSMTISLQSQQVAMAIDGQWVLLDLGDAAEDGAFNFGVGILPKLKESVTVVLGAPTVIFSSTQYPEESWKLFKWMANPETSLDLQSGGLWMPLMRDWYTDEDLLAKWALNNAAHPEGYVDAVAKQVLNNGVSGPAYTLRNFSKIELAVNAALERVWLGEVDAQTAMDELCTSIAGEMQGVYGQ